MLRFNRPIIRLGVEARRMTLVRFSSHDANAQAEQAEVLPGGFDAHAPEEGLARLVAKFADPAWQGRLHITLADGFAKYFIVEAVAGLRSRRELDVLTHSSFEKLFGLPAAAWNIRAGWRFPATRALACALPAPLLRSLTTLGALPGMQWQSLRPFMLQEFNQCCAQLTGTAMWFCVADRQLLTLAYLAHGRWQSVRSHTRREDLATQLRIAIAQDAPFLEHAEADAPIALSGVLNAAEKRSLREQGIRVLRPAGWPGREVGWTADFRLALAGGWQ